MKECFWGRSITASGACNDPIRYNNFGPFTPGFDLVEYGNLIEMEDFFQEDENIVAVMLEPIQGEAGVIIPPDGYLTAVQALCKKYNVLFICDEIQTGLGRTGDLMCYMHEGARPDIVTFGKALSGGIMPASAIMANEALMNQIGPGEHGSTFGGNPLACAASIAALKVIEEEGLTENSRELGKLLLDGLKSFSAHAIDEVRGRGLFASIEFKETG